eukprot:jgi/Tetstr1/458301/TSEL_000340.t1
MVAAVTKPTSRSPAMMHELRKLWHLLDFQDIRIRLRYIQSTANEWAVKLSREQDYDLRLAARSPHLRLHLQRVWGSHVIDRFASMKNTRLPRFNVRWRIRAFRYAKMWTPFNHGRLAAPETLFINCSWSMLDDLVDKLRQSGTAATVTVPHSPGRRWYQHNLELATDTIVHPRVRDMFFTGRLWARAWLERPGCSVVAFRLPLRPGCTPGEAP